MYHISHDKRAQKSAELIWQGMEQCLQEKPFDKLRISDINQKSYVSREPERNDHWRKNLTEQNNVFVQ